MLALVRQLHRNLPGCLTEPRGMRMSAAKAPYIATAAAEPPEEPPETRDVSLGFFVTPNAEFIVDPPIANSSIFAGPIKTTCYFFQIFLLPSHHTERHIHENFRSRLCWLTFDQKNVPTAIGIPASKFFPQISAFIGLFQNIIVNFEICVYFRIFFLYFIKICLRKFPCRLKSPRFIASLAFRIINTFVNRFSL